MCLFNFCSREKVPSNKLKDQILMIPCSILYPEPEHRYPLDKRSNERTFELKLLIENLFKKIKFSSYKKLFKISKS